MKLPSFNKYNNRFLQLKLYRKKQSNNLLWDSNKIEKLNLKKILHLVYDYHLSNKKILFLEFPESFHTCLKTTKHVLIPAFTIYPGILNNKDIKQKDLLTKKTKTISLNALRTLLKLNQKVDLILINNPNTNYDNLIKESYKSRIPIIHYFTKSNMLHARIDYKITTGYTFLNEKIISSNFFSAMIKATLKKAVRARHKKKQTSMFAYTAVHKN